MFIVIDDKIFNNTVDRCLKSKFQKTTINYKDKDGNIDKMKVIYYSNRLFIYRSETIFGRELIPSSKMLWKVCNFIQSIIFV